VQGTGVLEAHAVLGSRRKLRFTGLSEHRPGSAAWIREHSDAGLDPECQRDPSRTDICRADTVHGMVQAGWWTGNGVGSGPVSVELREWLRHVEEARRIPERSAGTWLEGGMALEAGDNARRVWWMRQDVGQLRVYVGAAGMWVQQARG
jgi:hypothetical protein